MTAGSQRWSIASVVGMLLVIAAVPVAAALRSDGDRRVPPGWRLESSLGVELAVPADWPINQTTCGDPGPGLPGILRGVTAVLPITAAVVTAPSRRTSTSCRSPR